MKRTFIAVDISEEAGQTVTSYIDGLRRAFPQLRVGWERPEKLHLTLKFLGDVNDSRLEKVQQVLERISGLNSVFRMTLGGTGRFPSKGDPRILWIGAQDERRSEIIASQIEKELKPLGFESEKRKFSPHLTIARLREPRLSSRLAATHLENEFEPVGFEVCEIVIYESKLLPKGSTYSKIAAYPLAEY